MRVTVWTRGQGHLERNGDDVHGNTSNSTVLPDLLEISSLRTWGETAVLAVVTLSITSDFLGYAVI